MTLRRRMQGIAALGFVVAILGVLTFWAALAA